MISTNKSYEKIFSKILKKKSLNADEFYTLIFDENEDFKNQIFKYAREITDKYFGRNIYFRGLIEFTNYCKNDCYYCGLQKSNQKLLRYRMSNSEILNCVKYGHKYGFRTFVLQGGEDDFFDDEILGTLIYDIKKLCPDCAVTLSVGERLEKSYIHLKQMGADRYLLRHEAANEDLYKKLHPKKQSLKKRLKCLEDLKKIGYQTGAGFMVGSPFQTNDDIVDDLIFLQKFKPQMVGVGPFIANSDTAFRNFENGSVSLTLRLLSIIRLILPKVLLPATTALETLCQNGILKAFECGANVIMPNLTPIIYRENYKLYDNKKGIIVNIDTMTELKKLLQKKDFVLKSTRGDYNV